MDPITNTLIGVVIGGLVSFGSTWILERGKARLQLQLEEKKWHQSREEKRLAEQREALKIAMSWIDPIDHALIKAWSLTQRYLHDADEENLRTNWPRLSTTQLPDPPAYLRGFLPDDFYQRGIGIVTALEELQGELLGFRPHANDTPAYREAISHLRMLPSELQEQHQRLRTYLTEEYLKSF